MGAGQGSGGDWIPEARRLAADVDASSRPSGENTTPQTVSEWPSRMLCKTPVFGSHSLTVLSSDAEVRSWPSGRNATALTPPE